LASGSNSSEIRLPNVCYSDPILPRTKSAAVKKDTRLLQKLSKSNPSSDDDNEQKYREEIELLKSALVISRERVVVKRPINAPPLGSYKKDEITVKGTMNRFDVYIIP